MGICIYTSVQFIRKISVTNYNFIAGVHKNSCPTPSDSSVRKGADKVVFY